MARAHTLRTLHCSGLVLVCLARSASSKLNLPARGNVGVWVYDHPEAEPPAQWARTIEAFNEQATGTGRLDHIVLYGSDMEIYDDWCCTPSSSTQMGRRLAEYGKDPATTLTFIIDGRMDGRESWSPNLSRLSQAQIVSWARWVARWVCAYERVDGVQLDLEPIAGPWNANLRLLLSELSSRLASRDFGCISPRRPRGVALSTFALARDVDVALFDALGPQGYVVVSGYDLGSGGPAAPHSPAAYEAALRSTLESIAATAAKAGKPYMVGIPAAASTNEFESFERDGELILSGHTQLEYVEAAIRSLATVAADERFLGPMVWTLSHINVYPPQSDNAMSPSSAYASAPVWQFLGRNLPGNRSLAEPTPAPTQPPRTDPPTPAPTEPPHAEPPTPTPTVAPTEPPTEPPAPADNEYFVAGCDADTNCGEIIGAASYCKDGVDECGRRICQGDSHASLSPCP